MKQQRTTPKAKRPVAVGTGLIALDAVVSADRSLAVRYWAGGTCGNVLIALKYLGWTAQPIARLAADAATELVLSDLRRWGVSKRYVRIDADGATPVIVERITRDASGRVSHSFSWRCETCGARYPNYKPELSSVAEALAPRMRNVSVFFFDRASPAALVLARAAIEAGAVVMFEPSGIGNPILFGQAWELSHIVKYSHERLSEFPDIDRENGPRLIIETLGQAGLRYRWRRASAQFGAWSKLKAIAVTDVKDTAGSGDWCTVGILARLGATGYAGFSRATDHQVRNAIQYGQALAAWNCRFEGARGGMYSVTRRQFHDQISELLSGNKNVVPLPAEQVISPADRSVICRVCELSGSSRKTAQKKA